MSSRELTGREEFGSYTLLKKLGEDPLGETFRAGRIGGKGMEQVVLLRVFNGPSIEPDTLWRQLSGRGAVQEALKSPNIGNGVELGRVRNVPFVAYDYVSGKSLSSLLAQVGHERSPLPTDHALLIGERIALGLATGYDTKVQEQRILHGFLVPPLLMLGNEGDMRVLGFEAAPGLREVVKTGSLAPEVARYLAPEALAGAPIHKADDVYSLGAILFELLTGQPLAAGTGSRGVDGARLAGEGTPIPTEIANLLKRSLAPQAERIPDVVTWHRLLSKLTIDGQYGATTFNLAFFMHNLFRDEIERESKEIEREKTLTQPRREVLAAAAAAHAAGTGTEAKAAAGSPTFGAYDATESAGAPAKGGNMALWGGLAALVLIGGGVGIYFGLIRDSTPPAQTETAALPADQAPVSTDEALPAAEPAADATVTAAAPDAQTQAELNAQLDKLLAERMAAMEKSVRSQYDEKIRALQQSIDQSQRAPAEKPAIVADASKPAPPPADPVPAPAAATPADSTASEPSGSPAPPDTTVADTAAEPAPSSAVPAATPVSAEPVRRQVRVGDLVEAGQAGVVPPKLKNMPNPVYPPAARRLNKSSSVPVRVRALVDENGRVTRAELGGPDPGYGFGDAALAAARSARFDPATLQGVRVKMWKPFTVEFKP